jgi:hypothetical protein
MWILIVGLLGFGLVVLALFGLLVVAKELFYDRPPDADPARIDNTNRSAFGGRAPARRCGVMR